MTFYNLGLNNEKKFDKRYTPKQLLILKEVNMNYISRKKEMLKVKRWPKDTIAAGRGHTVALKSDGKVMVVGWNEYGQCNVSNWRDIVAIAAGCAHTVGLKLDGTMVAIGDNTYGQCDVGSWRNIRLPGK